MAHLGCLIVDNLLGCQVTLVSDKQLVDILIGISVNFVEPLLDIVEAVLVCHVIHHLHMSASCGKNGSNMMRPHDRASHFQATEDCAYEPKDVTGQCNADACAQQCMAAVPPTT